MPKPLFLFLLFFLLPLATSQPSYTTGFRLISGEVAGSSGGGIWISGGITNNNPIQKPNPNPNNKNAYMALQAWKSAITEDPNGILTNWVGPNVCSYKGIFCSNSQNDPSNTPNIVGIDLNYGNLKGTLVKDLSLLTDLSLLHLNTNRFSGPIPSLSFLSSLSELDLSNNRFSGSFPTTVLSIPNLIYLDLRYNEFSGPIPEILFDNKLDAIFLNNNRFSGQIPSNLGNSPASVINFANNNFSGQIPFSLGYMGPRLKEILFLNNQLSGCIPEGVGIFQDLEVLDLSSNSLMGHLPDTISCLSNIEILNLGHNELSGELPDLVCELKNLLNLTVSSNFFSGFSSECEKLGNYKFDFSFNCVGGRDMQRPEGQCSAVPGEGLNCFRVPGGTRAVACAGL